ncbi:unnamed protein product, partial [Polarella glacialis]
GLRLETVSSVQELWEIYAFASRQIVQEVPSMLLERNFLVSLALQLAAFPSVYSSWEQYESCAVEELSLGPTGTVLGPLPRDAPQSFPAGSEQQVVLECGKMIDNYGLSLIARGGVSGSSEEIAGVATLRVKRLPEGCHVDDDLEQ